MGKPMGTPRRKHLRLSKRQNWAPHFEKNLSKISETLLQSIESQTPNCFEKTETKTADKVQHKQSRRKPRLARRKEKKRKVMEVKKSIQKKGGITQREVRSFKKQARRRKLKSEKKATKAAQAAQKMDLA
eukprot:c36712_g1_i1.p1 GENE.c36712_g1_i1~~c36712_g1_i1.p1  ORF type:complete len:144 (-),score=46.98 c36712_g1_i1:97-486(-)